jgi:hypothetical protein
MIKLLFLIWCLLGISGYVMYCMNEQSRPKKMGYLVVAFCTHTFFGLLGLFYGYVCFSSRKNKITEK